MGRPPSRWTDDIVRVAGSQWMQVATCRSTWMTKGEALFSSGRLSADDDDDEPINAMGSDEISVNASIAHIVLCCVAGRGISNLQGKSFTHPGMHANFFIHGILGFFHFQSKSQEV
uniref:SFRICE_014916 n=1 Tax=Spodoptera frugiperda TaxID=7108 RepID=A0A2H1X035_SPOFR